MKLFPTSYLTRCHRTLLLSAYCHLRSTKDPTKEETEHQFLLGSLLIGNTLIGELYRRGNHLVGGLRIWYHF